MATSRRKKKPNGTKHPFVQGMQIVGIVCGGLLAMGAVVSGLAGLAGAAWSRATAPLAAQIEMEAETRAEADSLLTESINAVLSTAVEERARLKNRR